MTSDAESGRHGDTEMPGHADAGSQARRRDCGLIYLGGGAPNAQAERKGVVKIIVGHATDVDRIDFHLVGAPA